MIRTLLLMRHAKSDWSKPSLSDYERPLNQRGRKAAPRMARHLESQGIEVDVVLASPATRARETWALMQENWSRDVELIAESSLYLASPPEIARQIHALHDSWQTALVIGHNPGMADLVSSLSGKWLDMPTAAVAYFSTEADSWCNALSLAEWRLVDYWRPRGLEIGKES